MLKALAEASLKFFIGSPPKVKSALYFLLPYRRSDNFNAI